MKQNIKIQLSALLSFLLVLTMATPLTQAEAGSGNSPTPLGQVPPPYQVSTDPWIGNLGLTPATYDLGSASPLTLQFDYANIPQGASLPTITIYKSGDLTKTNLFKNYINYGGVSIAGATPPSPGVQSGTETDQWYGQASTQNFVDPGIYLLEVSGTYGSTVLDSTQQFTLTNSTNAIPLNFYNVNSTPNPFNPHQGTSMNFNYTIQGLAAGETIQVSLIIGNSAKQTIYQSPVSAALGNGTYTISWNGEGSTQQIVADGQYMYVLQGKSSSQRGITAPGSLSINSTTVNPPVSPTPAPTPTPSPIVAPTPTVSNCAGFTDVISTDPNCNIYTWAKNAGIFTGNADGTFDPSGFLQRDQVAKVVLDAFGKYHAGTEYCQAGNPFPDVTGTSWAREYICLGNKTVVNGSLLLTGYKSGPNAGLFLPGNSVNRSEFLAIVLRNLTASMPSANTPSYSDVELNQWDSGYAAYAAEYLSSIYPQPTLNRAEYVTRLEAAKVLYALHNQGSF